MKKPKKEIRKNQAGLILITGKVNSGKSTTLNAVVQEINKRVKLIKEDKRTEVEYMTLLERDEKNREEARKDVARKLIKKGLDDVFIVEITDLTLQQVKELRNEL